MPRISRLGIALGAVVLVATAIFAHFAWADKLVPVFPPLVVNPGPLIVGDGVVVTGLPNQVGDSGQPAYNPIIPVAFHDGVDTQGNITCTASSPDFTVQSGVSFKSSDVGKVINVTGCGTAGGILSSTIAAFINAGHITLGSNAGTSHVNTSETVAYGHDDTLALQTAMNTCRFVQLVDAQIYLVQELTIPSCNPGRTNLFPTAGLVSLGSTVLRGIVSADNLYMFASSNWLTNNIFPANPYYWSGITFDAGNTAQYAVIENSQFSQYVNCHFDEATSYGIWLTNLTKNGSYMSGGITDSVSFLNSSAEYNTSDGLHADNTAGLEVVAPSDVQIRGGYWHDNGGNQLYIGASGGWLVQGIHTYRGASANTTNLDVPFLSQSSSFVNNIFEDNVLIFSTSNESQFGPGNTIGGTLTSHFSGNPAGTIFHSVENNFYKTTSGITTDAASSGIVISSEGDKFVTANFVWSAGINTSSTGTIVAKNDSVYNNGSLSQSGFCKLDGELYPTSLPQACTDFDIYKAANASDTSITFTITATVGNINAKPGGGGFALSGQVDATSTTGGGPTLETYYAGVLDNYIHQFNTTNVIHKGAVLNATDSGAAAVSAGNACVDTTVSSSGNNVETCTITVTIPSAQNSSDTHAHLHIHSENRQVVSLVVS